MKMVISVFQVLLSLTLIILILLQSSKGGLGGGLGSGEVYRTKRGAEKIIFMATIITAVLYLITSVSTVLVR